MVKCRCNFSSDEKAIIEKLSKETGLFFETVAILYSRGVDSVEKIDFFLNPSKSHFKSPFTLRGVTEAVQRIQLAREEGEAVAVYGDYDADGICASTVMYYALTEYGIEPTIVVPERVNGYGLQKDVLDKLIDEHFPTLLITVDCGISCYQEIEFLKENGIDVIVTDHHELPEKLPDCITINCKIPSDFGFDGLCGAGVAYKLAYALIGEKADEYLDFVAIATIADSMPLIGENRDIVFEGINLLKSGKAHPAISELIAISNMREISSSAIAFTIAPRINAAGRMGNAREALKLLTSRDAETIEELAVKMNSYNSLRQNECETLYKSARKKLIKSAYNKKIIVLLGDDWNSGLVGIIAAKLVEEFSRPVILFVNNEGRLHGSARSIESINIYEAISACKDLLIDFGGHAQAAGISVDIENYNLFVQAIERFIDNKYDYDVFKPQKSAELCISKYFDILLAKEINRLEPFGSGNKRPQFSVKVKNISAQPIKAGSPHLLIKTDIIDMLYFNGISMLEFINAGTEKEVIFEPNISVFNREESLKGYIKAIDFIVKPEEKVRLLAFKSSLLCAINDNDDYLYISTDMTKKVILELINAHFGTIFVIYNMDNLKYYEGLGLDKLDYSISSTLNRNLLNNVVVGLNTLDVEGFRRIVYLDRPLGTVCNFKGIQETFIDRSIKAFDYASLKTEKAVFADIFKQVRDLKMYAIDSVDFALRACFNYPLEQVVFALEVFCELEIFKFNNGYLKYNSEIKSSLDASKIYNEVLKLK